MTLGTFNNVSMTELELDRLYDKFGKLEADEKIEALSEYLATKNKRYKSHVAVILQWSRRDFIQTKQKVAAAVPRCAIPSSIEHDLKHYCDVCALPHVWKCTDKLCTLDREVPCPEWMAAFKARRNG